MDIYLDSNLAEQSAVLAISEALKKCGENDTIHLGGGELILDNIYANPTSYYLPRYTDRKKYYAISIKNRKNITIDGDGAILLLKGDVAGFEIENCENITLKNFKIDSYNPFYWQGLITDCCDEYFDVEFDSEISPFEYDDEKKVFIIKGSSPEEDIESSDLLVNEFDGDLKRTTLVSPDYFICAGKPNPFYDFMSVVVDTEKLGENKYRFRSKGKKITHTPGSYFVSTCHERRNNNIHLNKCKNITLEDIDMYASASFGVISLLVENLTIRNVNSLLKPQTNRLLAVVADMFHCVNNRGLVSIDNCTIENQKDDAINVHSLLCKIESILPDKHTAIISFPYRAKRALDLFCAGEKLHTMDPDTFENLGELTVLESEFSGQYHLRITFKETLGEEMRGLFLESSDAMPRIKITNCRMGNNRGRGILVSSSNETLIEGNRIYSQIHGILINGASKFYMEGGAVNDVKIKNNIFDDCSFRKSAAINICPRSIEDSRKTFYHKNILVTGNTFKLRGKNVIKASLVSGLYAKNNTYTNLEDTSIKTPEAILKNCEKTECDRFALKEEI